MRDFAAQIPQRMTRDGQAHADADGVLRADKRFENLVAHFGIESATMIGDADLHEFTFVGFFDDSRVDRNRAGIGGLVVVGLPRVDQHLRENLLENLVVGVEHQISEGIVDGDRSGEPVIAGGSA